MTRLCQAGLAWAGNDDTGYGGGNAAAAFNPMRYIWHLQVRWQLECHAAMHAYACEQLHIYTARGCSNSAVAFAFKCTACVFSTHERFARLQRNILQQLSTTVTVSVIAMSLRINMPAITLGTFVQFSICDLNTHVSSRATHTHTLVPSLNDGAGLLSGTLYAVVAASIAKDFLLYNACTANNVQVG
jgi:hypothetical protein